MANKKTISKNKAPITPDGYAYIKVSLNNTIITITNNARQPIVWASAGSMSFKGSKKNTPYAASKAAHECAEKASKKGIKTVQVIVNGLGNAREVAIRGLMERELNITAIRDNTPEPHGGCRPPKKRNP